MLGSALTWRLFLCVESEKEREPATLVKRVAGDAVVRGERALGARPGKPRADETTSRTPRAEADMEGRREELAAILRARAFPRLPRRAPK